MTAEEALKGLPQKGSGTDSSRMTTSLAWKKDVFEFFNKPEFQDKVCLELGCWDCLSSVVLSYVFAKVYAIQQMDRNEAKDTIKRFNRDNITLIVHDLYKGDRKIPVDRADVVVVDAEHTYDCVRSDIKQSLLLPSNGKKYFVFDDYGLIPNVRKAIDDTIAEGTLTKVQMIGWKKETDGFPAGSMGADEGIICIET